ncbi:MAG: hypothetical protein ACHBMF_07175 [Chromatiales bacterium]
MRLAYPFRPSRISRAVLPLLACVAFTLLPAPQSQAQSAVLSETVATQIPGRDLRVNPPAIASLTITPLGGVGALEKGLLKVRFKESGLPSSLRILHKGSLKTLRDDGTGDDAAQDGVYSARLDFKLEEMLEHHTNLRESGQAQSLPSIAAAAQDVSPLSVSTDLDPDKTLFIRDASVVNDPSRTSDPCMSRSSADAKKKWTFGYLMTQIANQRKTGRTPSDLAMSLLKQWETQRIINDDVVPARALIRDLVINPWLKASGNTGKLTMHKAPFRLLGIVNRVDLRQNLFFGEGLAGELRFVWGVLDLNPKNKAADGSCNEFGSFTLIMEYAVDKKTPAAVKAYGKKWTDLNPMTLDSAAYRDSLQVITESVVRAGAGAAKRRANGSALIRIRTNEITLGLPLGLPWELREFNLRRNPTRTDVGLFFETDVKQTPANEHNGLDLFAKFVNDKEAEILAGKHNVPHLFDGVRFRGGASENNIDSWNAPGIVNNEARHLVSVNTCNGCHGAETQTFFLHVVPRPRSQPAGLSGFLTGIDVPDPVNSAPVRHMHDLDRRAVDLHSLVSSPVLSQLGFQPTSRTH